uniref:Glycosyltransferase family 4 protein n=1 Tax=candidate division WWE3 bacterium TaxID=2053526 RepID=A0A831Z019_UNCKA
MSKEPPSISHRSLADLKVAVGHDDLTVPYSGGDKVFATIAETFPQADIFTSMITDLWRGRLEVRSQKSERKIITTFMQKIPLKRKFQKALFPLYPLAFESLDFSDYDLVISSSARFAHGVVTQPETKHICYMHSPGRMFWEPDRYFAGNPGLGKILLPALSYLRLWDYTAAQRVDQFISNSKNIARKIKRYYGRDAEVVYPFVDLERFTLQATGDRRPATGEYFLIVTRLEPWKRVRIAVEAANQAGVKLKIAGTGPDRRRLEKLTGSQKLEVRSKKSDIEILGGVRDEELVGLYQNCTAFIMTQEEDFGITALEAQACGKPVIAYGAGGALETVAAGQTGEFFAEQTSESLAEVLKRFRPERYDPSACRKNAEKFSKERFQRELVEVVERAIKG